MSTLVLSLLLVLLVGIGLLMGRGRLQEMFDNPPPATPPAMSPALANLVIGTPTDLTKPPAQPDALGRDQDTVAAANAVSSTPKCPACPACPSCPTCPKCPKCEDMSQYIRLDEVPCWNCTLP
jgi:hypothetical protein